MTDLRAVAQQALEALEERYVGALRDKAMDDLRAALAQQEQEPVAWMFQHEETRRMNYVSNDGCNSPGRFLVMNPRYALVCALYTAPPRREWKSLSDTEVRAIHQSLCNTVGSDYRTVARAIEAALKEKNQ